MCGILAGVSFKGRIDRDRFEAALEALAHRGPDGAGTHYTSVTSTAEVALGHRRLAVFDLSSAGLQPMADTRGRTIIYNGEVFNWPELRQELEAFGYMFHTKTDTEVILAAYDKWGPDCVTRFDGFWAIVLLDQSPGKPPQLFFSRDHFGIKPLYYRVDQDLILVSSEIGPINSYLGRDPEIDVQELARHVVLHCAEDSERTIYRGVFELNPASNILVDLESGALRQWTYWRPDRDQRFEGSQDAALEKFGELFENSVRLRLRADREVALTLSGGIDSSAIAVAINRIGNVSVRAFTSHFPDRQEIDETRYATLVAQRLGFEHTLVQPALENLSEEERKLTKHQELMYGGFSLLVNWAVVKQIAKSGVALFLTGQGGDELFLGYERYYVPYLMALLRDDPASVWKSFKEASRNSRLSLSELMAYSVYFSSTKLRGWRYRREARTVFNEAFIGVAEGAPTPLPASQFDLQTREIAGQQLRHLLRYDDRTAAAFGLESRPAFLDRRLVEFALSLGWDYKLHGGWTKYVIRRYLDRYGFPEIAWRREKLGYNAPTTAWTDALIRTNAERLSHAGGLRYLKPGIEIDNVPERMRFLVYNLLTTANEMRWAA